MRNNSHFQVETKVKEKHLQLRGKYSKREIKQGIANYHMSKECAQSERERQEEDSGSSCKEAKRIPRVTLIEIGGGLKVQCCSNSK